MSAASRPSLTGIRAGVLRRRRHGNPEGSMTVTVAQQEAPAPRIAFRMNWLRSSLVPYLLISPALLCLVTFSVLSIFLAAAISLTTLTLSGPAAYCHARLLA